MKRKLLKIELNLQGLSLLTTFHSLGGLAIRPTSPTSAANPKWDYSSNESPDSHPGA
jgi:hypothetical protein